MIEPIAIAPPELASPAMCISDDDDVEPPSGRPRLHLDLDVIVEAGDWSAAGALQRSVSDAARAIAADPTLAILFATSLEACVAFTGDPEVRLLNAQYRGQDKPTNVLSFAARAQPIGTMAAQVRFLGDIVLAAETVAAEAAEQNILLAHHIQHLVVHGVLHLLGFDHETDAEALRMEERERLILAALGIADPYAHNDRATGPNA